MENEKKIVVDLTSEDEVFKFAQLLAENGVSNQRITEIISHLKEIESVRITAEMSIYEWGYLLVTTQIHIKNNLT